MIPKFFIENGLRKVVPYYQVNSTFAKGHWLEKRVIDLLSSEFRVRPKEYYACWKSLTLFIPVLT